jgi:hypothetical protein
MTFAVPGQFWRAGAPNGETTSRQIFHYEATGGLLSPSGGSWSLSEQGLQATNDLDPQAGRMKPQRVRAE